ncbi:Anaerobic ribonucleoside-triphosphate reductase [termite gut metagenome]|uniref:Anaerobic ribonucleoside-triphosphate reductase n=1 Tax=termite gut metagenome TaxID=433724 RepID=A0A5J4R755_9ZZZZ
MNRIKSDEKELKLLLKEHIHSIDVTDKKWEEICVILATHEITIDKDTLKKITDKAYAQTQKDTHQAMEGFIHNLNTMHSRGGNQVVFSSINYGTNFSPEGRMVINELLKATTEGLGVKGEVPVFPIQIFKVKEGISYSEEDYQKAIDDFETAMAGKMSFKTPNFDLFLKACQTSAKALFPNFMFLDAPYNAHEKWNMNNPQRYWYEVASMGCRTRVCLKICTEKKRPWDGEIFRSLQ